MIEFLRSCLEIPYNSASSDLPEVYRSEPINTWGLDCNGFSDLVAQIDTQARKISGIYRDGQIHIASLIQHPGEGVFYIDPFLRMKEPLLLRDGEITQASSYLDQSNVIADFTSSKMGLLHICLFHLERCLISYDFDLKKPLIPLQSHGYRYTFIHEGYPLTIEKKRAHGSVQLGVKGGDPDIINTKLYESHGIKMDDIGQMFFDAAENARYQRAIEKQL